MTRHITGTVEGWDAVLDAFAERLAAQRAALTAFSGGQAEGAQPEQVPDFEPPDGLGPLPARLTERAAALVAEAEAVTAALEAAMARVGRELAAVERSTRATPPSIPSFIDQRA